MTALELDGRALAARIRDHVGERAAAFEARHGRRPTLVSVLVGHDPASVWYARLKGRAAEKTGLEFRLVELDASEGTEGICSAVSDLCADSDVDGVIVELPLPSGLDAARVQDSIDPLRDVDGASLESQGRLFAGLDGPRPATAVAVMSLLDAAEVELKGMRAVVVGRSTIVGKPAALMLLERHATVTVAHSRTRDLPAVTRQGDVVVVAVGVPQLVTADYISPGAVVIDVGTNPVGEGDDQRIVGDVDYAAVSEVAGAITPVPGGVGPVTVAEILRSTLDLAEAREG